MPIADVLVIHNSSYAQMHSCTQRWKTIFCAILETIYIYIVLIHIHKYSVSASVLFKMVKNAIMFLLLALCVYDPWFEQSELLNEREIQQQTHQKRDKKEKNETGIQTNSQILFLYWKTNVFPNNQPHKTCTTTNKSSTHAIFNSVHLLSLANICLQNILDSDWDWDWDSDSDTVGCFHMRYLVKCWNFLPCLVCAPVYTPFSFIFHFELQHIAGMLILNHQPVANTTKQIVYKYNTTIDEILYE